MFHLLHVVTQTYFAFDIMQIFVSMFILVHLYTSVLDTNA